MEDKQNENPGTQTQMQMNFSQIEEIFFEYQKNKQNIFEELMEGLNSAIGDLTKLTEDLMEANIREEKRKENLMMLRTSCCKITKDFYETIKFHFNMPLFKKGE